MTAGRLRCLTLNLWGIEAPLAERMALVTEGLAALAPDVVALQEVREAPAFPNQAAGLARAAGYHHVFAPATPFGGGQEGLALLSRDPIVTYASLELPHAQPQERRILLSACLETGAGPIWVHTTHLNYRLHHGKQREDQVLAIDEAVAARAGEAPQVLMGDLNARPESDEMRFLRGLTTLGGRRTFYQDAWERLFPEERGWTWSAANPYTARLDFLDRDRRIDYVLVTPPRRDGRGRIHACQIVFNHPSPEGVYASDHFGVCADVQIAAEGSP
jgi:endonuclease/exonuclease/phosphatase family metal-dependent hydrolase